MSSQESYLKGMEHFSEDRYDEAIEELKRALEMEPDYGDALQALAMCYYSRKDFDQAIQQGLRFQEVEPSNPMAYTSLSIFYQAKGMIPEAEEMGAKAQAAAAQEKSPDVNLS